MARNKPGLVGRAIDTISSVPIARETRNKIIKALAIVGIATGGAQIARGEYRDATGYIPEDERPQKVQSVPIKEVKDWGKRKMTELEKKKYESWWYKSKEGIKEKAKKWTEDLNEYRRKNIFDEREIERKIEEVGEEGKEMVNKGVDSTLAAGDKAVWWSTFLTLLGVQLGFAFLLAEHRRRKLDDAKKESVARLEGKKEALEAYVQLLEERADRIKASIDQVNGIQQIVATQIQTGQPIDPATLPDPNDLIVRSNDLSQIPGAIDLDIDNDSRGQFRG